MLNFALTLEILESDLYRQALNYASGLPRDYALNVNPKVYQLKVSGGGLSAGATAAGLPVSQAVCLRRRGTSRVSDCRHFGRGFDAGSEESRRVRFCRRGSRGEHQVTVDGDSGRLEETGVRAYLGALPYLTDLGLAQAAGSI